VAISNETFYKNLVASGALMPSKEPLPILPIQHKRRGRHRWRMFFELLGILIVFGGMVVLGFLYGVTHWSNG